MLFIREMLMTIPMVNFACTSWACEWRNGRLAVLWKSSKPVPEVFVFSIGNDWKSCKSQNTRGYLVFRGFVQNPSEMGSRPQPPSSSSSWTSDWRLLRRLRLLRIRNDRRRRRCHRRCNRRLHNLLPPPPSMLLVCCSVVVVFVFCLALVCRDRSCG